MFALCTVTGFRISGYLANRNGSQSGYRNGDKALELGLGLGSECTRRSSSAIKLQRLAL